jgi:hypothetical protein
MTPSTSAGTRVSKKRMVPVKPTVSSRSLSSACTGSVGPTRSVLTTMIAAHLRIDIIARRYTIGSHVVRPATCEQARERTTRP